VSSEQSSYTTSATETYGGRKRWWLMAGADLLREKSTADWLLVVGSF
jgi:hypothetical protein